MQPLRLKGVPILPSDVDAASFENRRQQNLCFMPSYMKLSDKELET